MTKTEFCLEGRGGQRDMLIYKVLGGLCLRIIVIINAHLLSIYCVGGVLLNALICYPHNNPVSLILLFSYTSEEHLPQVTQLGSRRAVI